MEQDPREQIEQEAEERREELDIPDVDNAGDAAAEGLIGPDQDGGPPPHPEVELEGGPPNPPGPATGDPDAPIQERDPSLVTPRMERDTATGAGTAIPASDLHPAERARLAHEPERPQVPESDRPILRPRRDKGDDDAA